MPRIEDIYPNPNFKGKYPKFDSWWDLYEDSNNRYTDPKQLEMEFLWPHNVIQLGLDLDSPEQPVNNLVVSNANTGLTFGPQTWGTTIINSNSLQIPVNNGVGELTIGRITMGFKETPKWYQRVLYKLLGFNWKDK